MELKKMMKEADMVLVGIGEVFQEDFHDVIVEKDKEKTIFEEYAKKKYLDTCQKNEIDEAYEKLSELLQDKNYFIVTLSNDDKIYKSSLRKDRIVAPCGTYHALQCEEVCTEDIYPIEEYENELEQGKIPVCPHCGKPLVMNHLGCKKYSEEGYLKQWSIYTKWLQGTLNRKVCILELGAGMRYPSVIRWPFEKVTFLNQKASLIRVHQHLYQLTEEIGNRGISVEEDPIDFLRNQIV